MLAWLSAQLMPLPLTISCSSRSRLVLPFWYRLTRVVPDKIQEGRKTVVCVCVRESILFTSTPTSRSPATCCLVKGGGREGRS